MQMQEAQVMTCHVGMCSWNCDDQCCSPTIEIGEDHPRCDTFTTVPQNPTDVLASIAGCKVAQCHFNEGTRCGATGVTLEGHAGHADCATFRE